MAIWLACSPVQGQLLPSQSATNIQAPGSLPPADAQIARVFEPAGPKPFLQATTAEAMADPFVQPTGYRCGAISCAPQCGPHGCVPYGYKDPCGHDGQCHSPCEFLSWMAGCSRPPGDLYAVPETTTKDDPEGGVLPDYIGPIVEIPFLNPGRGTYYFQRALGIDPPRQSNRPTVSMPDGVFFELMRPLSSLAYDNEINFMFGDYTGDLWSPQLMEIEWAVADWHSLEWAFMWENGDPTFWMFGYQPTFGVGPNNNWVHGAEMYFPIDYINEEFIGATLLYIFGWKPSEHHPFNTYLFLGANRVPATHRTFVDVAGNFIGTQKFGSLAPRSDNPNVIETTVDVWRPVVMAHYFYEVHPHLWVGIENNFFLHETHDEILILPQTVWHPIEHFEIRSGIGYFESGDEAGAAFLTRVVIETDSPRKPCDKHDPNCDYGWQGIGSVLATIYDGTWGRLFE